MGRSPCCEKEHTNKGAWTKEEDDRLISYIKTNGEGCWRSLPKNAGLQRCGKSCRLRWINYLRPDLKRGNFTEEEDELIINLHSLLGNKWSLIASRLQGRTDNEIKNYWNTRIKRKLLSRGINPQTHRPNDSAATTSISPTFATTVKNNNHNMSNINYSQVLAVGHGEGQEVDQLGIRSTGVSYNVGGLNQGSSRSEDSNNSSSVVTMEHENFKDSYNLDLSISLPISGAVKNDNVIGSTHNFIDFFSIC